jgi:hypothetical protein
VIKFFPSTSSEVIANCIAKFEAAMYSLDYEAIEAFKTLPFAVYDKENLKDLDNLIEKLKIVKSKGDYTFTKKVGYCNGCYRGEELVIYTNEIIDIPIKFNFNVVDDISFCKCSFYTANKPAFVEEKHLYEALEKDIDKMIDAEEIILVEKFIKAYNENNIWGILDLFVKEGAVMDIVENEFYDGNIENVQVLSDILYEKSLEEGFVSKMLFDYNIDNIDETSIYKMKGTAKILLTWSGEEGKIGVIDMFHNRRLITFLTIIPIYPDEYHLMQFFDID